MIQLHLLSVQLLWVSFMRILNPNRKRRILIVFDDMIADIMTNKKFQAIIKELLIRCRKLNISLISIHYLIMKINNKRKLQNLAINHSADVDYQNLMKIYRECTKEPFNFLTLRYQQVIL